MKIFRPTSLILAVVVVLNLLGTTAFAQEMEPPADGVAVTDAVVLEQREYTDLDKRQEAIPAMITEPEDKIFDQGKLVDGMLVHEESFQVDSFLKGTNARMETTFSVGEWMVNKVELTLVYSASQFIDNTKSSLTVLINGVRCVTEAQPSTYGERSQIKLTLPASELKLGINTLAVEADILTMGTAPETPGSIESGWFNVFQDSTIAVAYQPLNTVATIQDFYKRFTSIESLDFKNSAVAVPQKATNAELKNAMIVMSGASKNTELYSENFCFEAADSLSGLSDFENIIYMAGYDTLPAEIKAMLTDWQKKQAEENAVIALLKTGTQNILLATGKNETALENAARLLANGELLSQMAYTGRGVTQNESFELTPAPFEQYRTLTKTGTHLEGESVQSVSYYIDFPYNRSITDQSQLYLVFRYADNLDYQRSLMTVYLNETPIASKRLSQDSAEYDEVTIHIPTDIPVSGNFVLRVAFDLRVSGTGGAAPWAFISPESTLKINSASQPFLVFENYPSPLVKDGTFNDVLVVLPQEPTKADYTVLAQTFNLFGQYMDSVRGNLTVVRDSEIFDVANKNVISIGVQKNNKYTQSLNKNMFFQFSEDGQYLLSNEKMMIDPTFSKDVGTVQLLESPSGQDHVVLVMTGTSEAGLLKATSYLKTPDFAWKVFGDGFVTDKTKIYNFKFKDDNSKTLSIPSKLRVRQDLTSLIVVLSMLSGIALLSFIFMAVRYRKGGESNEKQ